MTIGSTDASNCAVAGTRSRFGQFCHGRINLNKADLEAAKTKRESEGKSTTKLDNLIANYDKIDLNSDGISKAELRSYRRAERAANDHSGPTKEQLESLRDKLSEKGRSTENLDKVIQGFNDADANQDGSLNRWEMREYAKANGINIPYGRHHHRRAHGDCGTKNTGTCGTEPVQTQETQPASDVASTAAAPASAATEPASYTVETKTVSVTVVTVVTTTTTVQKYTAVANAGNNAAAPSTAVEA